MTKQIERKIKFIEKEIQKDKQMPHLASVVAFEFFLLIYILKEKDEKKIRKLYSVFINQLSNWNLENLLDRQIEYAIKLADSEGKLEYEEMHKLFSLCDEIYALETLGFTKNKKYKLTLEEALKKRFLKEKKKAKLVSEDKVDNWRKELWWYKDNIIVDRKSSEK